MLMLFGLSAASVWLLLFCSLAARLHIFSSCLLSLFSNSDISKKKKQQILLQCIRMFGWNGACIHARGECRRTLAPGQCSQNTLENCSLSIDNFVDCQIVIPSQKYSMSSRMIQSHWKLQFCSFMNNVFFFEKKTHPIHNMSHEIFRNNIEKYKNQFYSWFPTLFVTHTNQKFSRCNQIKQLANLSYFNLIVSSHFQFDSVRIIQQL